MALLCVLALFLDSELLPTAYGLTFNLLALLCTPPPGGKTSCCLLPVFCLLFRFVLQGLIIKTKFFGHLFVLWKRVNEMRCFPINGLRGSVPLAREWSEHRILIFNLTFPLLAVTWMASEQKPNGCRLPLIFCGAPGPQRAAWPRGCRAAAAPPCTSPPLVCGL